MASRMGDRFPRTSFNPIKIYRKIASGFFLLLFRNANFFPEAGCKLHHENRFCRRPGLGQFFSPYESLQIRSRPALSNITFFDDVNVLYIFAVQYHSH